MRVYEFKAMDMNGDEKNLRDYEGKVLLIVNTATECGFTPQYDDLQDIYEKYQSAGLEILDFPCNQFGNQAPGDNQEIASFCDSRFGITFPQFSKKDRNSYIKISCLFAVSSCFYLYQHKIISFYKPLTPDWHHFLHRYTQE